jgi:hypothetical protein
MVDRVVDLARRMNRKDKEYAGFKKEFWKWFDDLPWYRKHMFWNYKDDMAETNFYFTAYSKRIKKDG